MSRTLNKNQWRAISEKAQRVVRYIAPCRSVEIYRRIDGGWVDIDTGGGADDSLAASLAAALDHGDGRAWESGATVYVPLGREGVEAVAVLRLDDPPDNQTAQDLGDFVNECVRDALNAYGARYDNLVHLLNRDALHKEVVAALTRLLDTDGALDGGGQPSLGDEGGADDFPRRFDPEAEGPPFTVAVFAMDIDKFKQINDTFGHYYGDCVLICVGRRLKELCDRFATEYGGRVRFQAARPSGEEFFIVVQGFIDPEGLDDLARRVCERFSYDPLPNDGEIRVLEERDPSITRSLPEAAERNVTISLGVAFSTAISPHESSRLDQIASALKEKADAAMYRAKGDGRNTWRHFRDIREKHGRVLEHRKEPEVVVIDIGSQVGVEVGQEYVVYHPEFTGESVFTLKTDRSLRPLGRYPKIASGRIVITDVEKEVAFAKLKPGFSRTVSQFVPGSVLHAVTSAEKGLVPVAPGDVRMMDDGLGLDAALPLDAGQPPVDEGDRDLGAVSAVELAEWVSETVRGGTVLAAAITPIGAETVVKERGRAVMRKAVAQVIATVRAAFPDRTVVALLRETQVLFATSDLGAASGRDGSREITRIVSSVEAQYGEIVRFVAGWAAGPRQDAKGYTEQGTVDPRYLPQLAQCAVAAALSKGVKVKEFDRHDAKLVLRDLRNNRQYAQALREYYNFREYGVRAAALESIAAQCAYEDTPPNFEEALTAIERAIDLSPNQAGFHAMRGMIAVASGNAQAAWEAFERAAALGYKPSPTIMPSYVMAAYYGFKLGRNRMPRYELYDLLSKISRQDIPAYLRIDRAALQDALADVGAAPRA